MHLSKRTAISPRVAASNAVALLCAVLACSSGGCGKDSVPAAASVVSLVGLDGEVVVPLADGDRPDLFLFVRTDCPISNRYAPETRRLHEAYGDRVDFWLVYADADESTEEIREHVAAYGYDCSVLRDPGHDLVAMVGATITPEAALFMPGGAMAYRGRIDDLYASFGKSRRVATQHDLQDALEAVIAGRPVAVPRTDAVGCYIVDMAAAGRAARQRVKP